MAEDSNPGRAGAVLQVLADLSPSSTQQSASLVIPTDWFHWLPVSAAEMFNVGPATFAGEPPTAPVPRKLGDRLQAIDLIRPFESSIRVGWLFLAGITETAEGKRRRVFLPLVHRPVRASVPLVGSGQLTPSGDVSLTELVDDPDLRQRFEATIPWGGGAFQGIDVSAVPDHLLAQLPELGEFARAVAKEAHLPATEMLPARSTPRSLMKLEPLQVLAGVGVFATNETSVTTRASALRGWANRVPETGTAFHSVYVDTPSNAAADAAAEVPLQSPSLLTPAQRSAVLASRDAAVSVISGAPGTGKSHTLVAIALDALSRGDTVLVAAKTDAAVDALLTLLESAPGPDPVVFGSTNRRGALADRLSSGQAPPISNDQLQQAFDASETAWQASWEATQAVAAQLQAAAYDATALAEITSAEATAPGMFRSGVDLDELTRMVSDLQQTGDGWWERFKGRRLERKLRSAADAPLASLDQLSHALRMAQRRRSRVALELAGGLEIGATWDTLLGLEQAAREATSQWLAADGRSKQRLDGTLPAVSALATALRSGRAARRQMLGSLDATLTQALPLWIGSLTDIDDLLPMAPALFDLVILDEASSLTQVLAAPALLRGQRAVVAGDPKQLRQVSFVSDQQIEEVLQQWSLGDDPVLASRLNVRRNSTFDAAAGVAPVRVLDEHFRASPHLMDFVADEFYDGLVKVATRSPLNQSSDCIEVVRLEGERNSDGVVTSEVDWCIDHVRELLRNGQSSIGLVSPFRAQADALEAAVLDAFSGKELEQLDLRVGTVHAFQGNEREQVIVSLGAGSDVTANTWRFVEDPHLFAVMVTRARQHLTVLASGEPPAGGLIDRYLAQEDAPPGPPGGAAVRDPWVEQVAEYARAAGVSVTVGYPTGHHVLDLVVGGSALTIECTVHPDGTDAHIQRHLQLRDLGWTILEAHESRWGHRRGELAVELHAKIQAAADHS